MSRGKKRNQELQAARRRNRTILGVGGGIAALVVGLIVFNNVTTPTAEAAPTWTATTVDGETIGSAALAGKVYAMDFFFLTCGICEIQLPENKKMVDGLAGRDDFVLISVTADPADTVPLIQEHRVEKNATWPHVRDTSRLLSKFEAYSNPNIVFVDRDGNIALTVREITDGAYLLDQARRLLEGQGTTEPAPGQTQAPRHGPTHPGTG